MSLWTRHGPRTRQGGKTKYGQKLENKCARHVTEEVCNACAVEDKGLCKAHEQLAKMLKTSPISWEGFEFKFKQIGYACL